MCTLEQLKKDHLTIITAFVLKDKYLYAKFRLRTCIIVISLISDKINKPVSKETFVEASNVVDEPLKVIN